MIETLENGVKYVQMLCEKCEILHMKASFDWFFRNSLFLIVSLQTFKRVKNHNLS